MIMNELVVKNKRKDHKKNDVNAQCMQKASQRNRFFLKVSLFKQEKSSSRFQMAHKNEEEEEELERKHKHAA